MQDSLKVFGGGAECYIPDFFGGNGFNITCMLVGVIACVIYILVQIKNRMNRAKEGLRNGSSERNGNQNRDHLCSYF